jgi:hypothetical protein
MHRVLFFPVIPGLSIRGEGGYSRKGLFEYLELEKLTILSNLLERNCGQNLGLKRKLGGLGGGPCAKKTQKMRANNLCCGQTNFLAGGARPMRQVGKYELTLTLCVWTPNCEALKFATWGSRFTLLPSETYN